MAEKDRSETAGIVQAWSDTAEAERRTWAGKVSAGKGRKRLGRSGSEGRGLERQGWAEVACIEWSVGDSSDGDWQKRHVDARTDVEILGMAEEERYGLERSGGIGHVVAEMESNEWEGQGEDVTGKADEDRTAEIRTG